MDIHAIIISVLWILCGVLYGIQQYKGIAPSWTQMWVLYICYMISVVIPVILAHSTLL